MRLEVSCYERVNKLKLTKLNWVKAILIILLFALFFSFSSPFFVCVFVFGDDHVTCYVGANVNSCDNAYA